MDSKPRSGLLKTVGETVYSDRLIPSPGRRNSAARESPLTHNFSLRGKKMESESLMVPAFVSFPTRTASG